MYIAFLQDFQTVDAQQKKKGGIEHNFNLGTNQI